MQPDNSELEFALPPAIPGDPGLDVYALMQFVFCRRAGIIAAEQADPNADEQPEMRRLDYVPRWSLDEIERRLAELFQAGFFWLGVVAGITALSMIGLLLWPVPSLLLGLSGLGFVAWRIAGNVRQTFELSERRQQANEALPIEPVWPFSEPEPVNWWQLFQAGFVSRRYFENLADESLQLSDIPWRVLHRGSQRIPVCRMHGADDLLQEQHLVQMTAFCHLIEVCTGQESPFGIILWRNSFDGVAIPKTAANLDKVARAIVNARSVLKTLASTGKTPEAPPEHVCAKCPLGFPRSYRRGQTETQIAGAPIPVCPARGADGRIYHSQCGDRFDWLPPHARAEEKELLPAV